MELKNKTVLVTGSSSGIGRAIAIELAKKGSKVLVHYRKSKEGANETLKEVEKYSSGKVYSADLSELEEVRKLFGTIKRDYGTIDILVNNAGEAAVGEFDDIDLWRTQFENIFMSQVYACNEFLKAKGKNIRKIVNISSVYGFSEMSNPSLPQYSASKAALNSFTCSLANTVAPEVIVNAVAPGYTWTPAWEGTSEKGAKSREIQNRIRRFVTAEEVAHSVVALTENDAIVGEIIRVDGGLHLHEYNR